MKNYKTTIAFYIFMAAFVYAVYKENVPLVEATSFVVLVSWALLKASSETFNKAILGLVERFKNK